MISIILIRKIKNKIVNTSEFIFIIVYINDIIDKTIKIIYFTTEIYFIKDFKINIFLGTDIMIL